MRVAQYLLTSTGPIAGLADPDCGDSDDGMDVPSRVVMLYEHEIELFQLHYV